MQKEWKKDQLHVENTDGVSPYFNIVPLFHLRDPHKTRQFSLHIVQPDRTVLKGMHEVCAEEGWLCIQDLVYDSHRLKAPLPD